MHTTLWRDYHTRPIVLWLCVSLLYQKPCTLCYVSVYPTRCITCQFIVPYTSHNVSVYYCTVHTVCIIVHNHHHSWYLLVWMSFLVCFRHCYMVICVLYVDYLAFPFSFHNCLPLWCMTFRYFEINIMYTLQGNQNDCFHCTTAIVH